MSDKEQRLVLAIIDFLKEADSVKEEDKESLDIAIQCIGEAFAVDPTDPIQRDRLNIKPASLKSIFDVFLKTRDRAQAQQAPPPPAVPKTPSADDKKQAEEHKAAGNKLMTAKKYDDAIQAYARAIAVDPTNPVYYSNRAAAHISKQDYQAAILDAEEAIEVDPAFVRAYSRLGHAQYSLGDYKAAASAYRRGLEIDPENANMKNDLKSAEARLGDDEDDMPPLEADAPVAPGGGMPDMGAMGGMADMLRGMGGGGGGGGGMPDLASMMQNPMMMQMAQQMMAGGGADRLMSNPAVANMMNRMQSGGGMPSMSELMSDPTLRDLASQFGAGRGQ